MTCPYCQTRPIAPYRGHGKRPAHCGDRACRLQHRRVLESPWYARGGFGQARERRSCAYCTGPFWTTRTGQRCCSPSCGRQLHGDDPRVVPSESTAAVEAALAQARAARLAEERRTGQRRYRIESGWLQRPGRSTLDGEVQAWATNE